MKFSSEKFGGTFHHLPSLHLILLGLNLMVLLLPLGSIYFLKLYENELIRQTQSELIAQSAFIAAAYKQEVLDILGNANRLDTYGIPIPARNSNEYYLPVPLKLDLARDKVLSSRPDGKTPNILPDLVSQDAGDRITPVLVDGQRTTLAGMKIFDYQGIAVAGRLEVGQSFAHLPELKHVMETGEPISTLRKRVFPGRPPLASMSRGAGINVFVTFPVRTENRLIGIVQVNRTPKDILKALYANKENVLFGGGLVLLVTIGLTIFTSFTISRPIHALISQTQRLSDGDPKDLKPIEQPVSREIAALSESFSAMARTLRHRSDYIRNFAMHVSHEFKTPLTSIQGTIELLQEHLETMPKEKRKQFLGNIAEDTDRLNRLVSRLLELARADVMQPLSEPVDILPIFGWFASRYRDRQLTIQLENQTKQEALFARIAPEVLETALVNLLDNSLQHGADHVRIELARENQTVIITVTDNGEGISEADQNNIFTPFFTTYRERGGTGLGLSITRALLENHYGTIRAVTPADNLKGAQFIIMLPLAQ